MINKNGTTYEEYLNMIVQISNINYTGFYHRSYLHLALSNRYIKIFNDLLYRGIDVNIKDASGNTAAVYAATGMQWECLDKILDCYPDIDVKNNDGETLLMTVLHRAGSKEIRDKRYRLIQRLLDMGANPLAQNICGLTPMKLAQILEDEKSVRMFKDYIDKK